MNAEPSASDDLETELSHARDSIVRIKALAYEKNVREDEAALKVIRQAERFLKVQVEQGRQAAARLARSDTAGDDREKAGAELELVLARIRRLTLHVQAQIFRFDAEREL
jgi:hypothetical protein